MAWLAYERIVEGVELSGKYGESMRVNEKWQIRVDSPQTSKAAILSGVTGTIGITWGSPHPELADLKAMEFTLSPVNRDGMLWVLTVVYYAPPPAKKPPTAQPIPDDVWERSGGTTSVPVFVDTNNASIVNSAGDPLEGLEREREESSWTLTKCFENDAALAAAIEACAGKVNSGAWANGAAKTWKCYFKSAKKVVVTETEANELQWIESHWEFRYEPQTWKCMPWDVGFMELVSGQRKVITTDDGKAVKQPVALNSNGTKKAAGSPPSVIKNGQGVDIYQTASFSDTFGSPELIAGA